VHLPPALEKFPYLARLLIFAGLGTQTDLIKKRERERERKRETASANVAVAIN